MRCVDIGVLSSTNFGSHRHRYSNQDVALYALAVGEPIKHTVSHCFNHQVWVINPSKEEEEERERERERENAMD
jgi:hypothetical protein